MKACWTCRSARQQQAQQHRTGQNGSQQQSVTRCCYCQPERFTRCAVLCCGATKTSQSNTPCPAETPTGHGPNPTCARDTVCGLESNPCQRVHVVYVINIRLACRDSCVKVVGLQQRPGDVETGLCVQAQDGVDGVAGAGASV